MSMDGREGRLEQIKIKFEKLSSQNPQAVAEAMALLDSIWQSAGKDLESQFPELYPEAKKADEREYNKNYWLAKNEKTGESVGLVGYSEFRGDAPKHAWLGWFCVKRELQGKRVGVDLINYVTQQLKSLGKTDLYVQTSDRPAMAGNSKFYDRNDFPVVASMDSSRKIDIGPDAGNLAENTVRTVVEVNDSYSSEHNITNFIRRRSIGAAPFS